MDERAPSEPITAVIAERVRRLRLERGLTQEALAAAMRAQDIAWRRGSVAELERRAPSSRGRGTGGRDAVTAGELLALARVLGVETDALLAEQPEGVS